MYPNYSAPSSRLRIQPPSFLADASEEPGRRHSVAAVDRGTLWKPYPYIRNGTMALISGDGGFGR